MRLPRRTSPDYRVAGNLEKIAGDLRRVYMVPHWYYSDYLGVVYDAWIIVCQYYPVVANPSGLIFVIARRMVTQRLKAELREWPIDTDAVHHRIARHTYLHWFNDDDENLS